MKLNSHARSRAVWFALLVASAGAPSIGLAACSGQQPVAGVCERVVCAEGLWDVIGLPDGSACGAGSCVGGACVTSCQLSQFPGSITGVALAQFATASAGTSKGTSDTSGPHCDGEYGFHGQVSAEPMVHWIHVTEELKTVPGLIAGGGGECGGFSCAVPTGSVDFGPGHCRYPEVATEDLCLDHTDRDLNFRIIPVRSLPDLRGRFLPPSDVDFSVL